MAFHCVACSIFQTIIIQRLCIRPVLLMPYVVCTIRVRQSTEGGGRNRHARPPLRYWEDGRGVNDDGGTALSGLFVRRGESGAVLQLHVAELGRGDGQVQGGRGGGGGGGEAVFGSRACVENRPALLRVEEGPRVQLGAAEETLAELRARPVGGRLGLGGRDGLRLHLAQAEPPGHGRPDHRHARAVQEERRRQVQGLRVRRTQVRLFPSSASRAQGLSLDVP